MFTVVINMLNTHGKTPEARLMSPNPVPPALVVLPPLDSGTRNSDVDSEKNLR